MFKIGDKVKIAAKGNKVVTEGTNEYWWDKFCYYWHSPDMDSTLGKFGEVSNIEFDNGVPVYEVAVDDDGIMDFWWYFGENLEKAS